MSKKGLRDTDPRGRKDAQHKALGQNKTERIAIHTVKWRYIYPVRVAMELAKHHILGMGTQLVWSAPSELWALPGLGALLK